MVLNPCMTMGGFSNTKLAESIFVPTILGVKLMSFLMVP